MSELRLKILTGLKWWAAIFAVLFLIVLITAPSLFGVLFISSSAVASCLLYAFIGFVFGYRRVKQKN